MDMDFKSKFSNVTCKANIQYIYLNVSRKNLLSIVRRKVKKTHLMVHTPLSAKVSTNLTKVWNNLLRTHFKPNTLLGKLFNKNTLELSYCTTATLIKS